MQQYRQANSSSHLPANNDNDYIKGIYKPKVIYWASLSLTGGGGSKDYDRLTQ